MYAIIKTGGKQYRVQEGDVITIEKLNAPVGEKVTFEEVLVMGEGADVQVGTPFLEANVYGEVVETGKGKKDIIYKYNAKKYYRKKQGHRQPFTKVEITGIGTEGKKTTKKAAPKKEEAPKAKATKPAEESKAEKSADSVSMSMKKDELLAVAESKGVEVNSKMTKQEIFDAISAAK